MPMNPTVDRTETIARLNDRARLGLDPTAWITFTRNCLTAFSDPDAIEVVVIQSQLLAAIRTCTFAEDSPERDFGTIEFRGRKVWLKADYYDSELVYGSDDPADASVTTRVLTILLPEDY